MDEELEVYGEKMKIEICVKCGQISEVALRTIIELPDNSSKSKQLIRDTILLLRSTIPVTEIKAEDQAYTKTIRDPAVGPDGRLTLTDTGLAAARAGQEDLKKKLEGVCADSKTPISGPR